VTERRLNNIILIGYRGSGKTTVGRMLAERLGWSFVDTDVLVESEAGMSIAAIFTAEGEAGFRARERDTIARVVENAQQVIAIGGGAVTDQDNVDRLRSAGTIIWLTATAEVLWARIEADQRSTTTRPDLTPVGGLEEVRTILARREAAYKMAADVCIDTRARNAHEVAAAAEIAVRAVNAD
jgi:shikimate kinase